MNIHHVPGENLLVLFLRARWTDYEVEQVSDAHVRYRPRGDDRWEHMDAADGSGDHPYYSALAVRWDADHRRDDAKNYW